MAEPANASIGSPYCNEEEISSNLLDACYWESFVKGSNAPSTFSADVHTAFEYVEVEIKSHLAEEHGIRRSAISGDGLSECL